MSAKPILEKPGILHVPDRTRGGVARVAFVADPVHARKRAA